MLSMDPDKRRTAAPLADDPPNPINPPLGCRFHTRCIYAGKICKTQEPQLSAITDGHLSACHLVDPASGHTQFATSDKPETKA